MTRERPGLGGRPQQPAVDYAGAAPSPASTVPQTGRRVLSGHCRALGRHTATRTGAALLPDTGFEAHVLAPWCPGSSQHQSGPGHLEESNPRDWVMPILPAISAINHLQVACPGGSAHCFRAPCSNKLLFLPASQAPHYC